MAPAWVIDYFCPTLGTFLASCMWVSSIPAVLNARKNQDLGSLNPLPWSMGLANCIIWIIYSTIIKNYFVFCANFLGVILLSSYCLTAIALLSKKDSPESAKAVNILEKTIILMITAYTFVALIVGIVLSGGDNTSAIKNLVGIIALVVNIFYYAAPCSTLLHCIRTRDASSMLFPLISANLANATLWFFYGLIGLNDPYIYVPNVLGILFAVISMIARLKFPGKSNEHSTKLIDAENGTRSTTISSFDGVDNSSVAKQPLH